MLLLLLHLSQLLLLQYFHSTQIKCLAYQNLQNWLCLIFKIKQLPIIPNLCLNISSSLLFHVQSWHHLLDYEFSLSFLLMSRRLIREFLNIWISLGFLFMYCFIFLFFSHYLGVLNPLHCSLNNCFRFIDHTRVGVSSYDSLVPHDVACISDFLSELHLLNHSGWCIEFVIFLQQLCSHFRININKM